MQFGQCEHAPFVVARKSSAAGRCCVRDPSHVDARGGGVGRCASSPYSLRPHEVGLRVHHRADGLRSVDSDELRGDTDAPKGRENVANGAADDHAEGTDYSLRAAGECAVPNGRNSRLD